MTSPSRRGWHADCGEIDDRAGCARDGHAIEHDDIWRSETADSVDHHAGSYPTGCPWHREDDRPRGAAADLVDGRRGLVAGDRHWPDGEQRRPQLLPPRPRRGTVTHDSPPGTLPPARRHEPVDLASAESELAEGTNGCHTVVSGELCCDESRHGRLIRSTHTTDVCKPCPRAASRSGQTSAHPSCRSLPTSGEPILGDVSGGGRGSAGDVSDGGRGRRGMSVVGGVGGGCQRVVRCRRSTPRMVRRSRQLGSSSSSSVGKRRMSEPIATSASSRASDAPRQ